MSRIRKAGPVKITRADGTTEYQWPYNNRKLIRIVEKGHRQPRTWDEINSTKGGGKDFARDT